jgi:hypothetical protein
MTSRFHQGIPEKSDSSAVGLADVFESVRDIDLKIGEFVDARKGEEREQRGVPPADGKLLTDRDRLC